MKYLQIAPFILFHYSFLFSQSNNQMEGVSIGIKTSLVMSDFRKLSQERITTWRLGFNSGMQLDIKFSHFYSLRLGVQYVDKGYTFSNYLSALYLFDEDLGEKMRVKFQTIEIPLVSVFKLKISDKTKFLQSLGLGLECWAFKANEEVTSSSYIYYDGFSYERKDFENQFRYDKKVGFNLIIGPGIEIDINKLIALDILMSYQIGLDNYVASTVNDGLYIDLGAFYPRSYLSFDVILFFKVPTKESKE